MDKNVNPRFSSCGTNGFIKSIADVLGLCFVMALFFGCSDDGPDDDPNSIVKNLTPNTGQPGTIVTIKGIGFSLNPADNLVAFNGVPAEVLEATATELKVAAPEGASKGMVEVSVNGQTVEVGEFKFYNLYAYGSNFGAATYWKNGAEVQITAPNSEIRDMAISGSDVYAVGWQMDGTSATPECWKNGKLKPLKGSDTGGANAIAVLDSNYHILGSASYNSGTVLYWNQGVGTVLSSYHSFPGDIALDNDGVHILLWHNGTADYLVNGAPKMQLKDGISNSFSKIVIQDGVVHIAGTRDGYLRYWRDEQEHVYKDRASVYGLCVLGDDVYISGASVYESSYKAAYWKNGEMISIRNDQELSYAIVEATDDAMYILVNDSKGSKLYKNDEQITPDLGPTNEDRIAGIMIEYY